MNTLTIKSWCKPQGAERSIQMGDLHFHVNDADHLLLEEAEERLQKTHEPEVMFDAEMEHMELITPSECGSLSDLQFRVFLSKDDDRGMFHLVGHRESDGSLVYTNTVMIDQLG